VLEREDELLDEELLDPPLDLARTSGPRKSEAANKTLNNRQKAFDLIAGFPANVS
jgi:hypothetical protein